LKKEDAGEIAAKSKWLCACDILVYFSQATHFFDELPVEQTEQD